MKQQLSDKISSVISNLYQLHEIPFTVDYTNELGFGDLSTNVAMVLAGRLHRNPRELATEIAEALQNAGLTGVSVVNGFINFSLSPDILWNFVQQKTVIEQSATQRKRILAEYGDPNTHKLPHIGHPFSYTVGDSIAKILETVGHTVMKANYQGDVGLHVAKSLYGYIQVGQPKPEDLLSKVRLLQKCYQEGSAAYEEDPLAKETIDDINKKIYARDPEIMAIWKETRQWSVDYYHLFEQRLGIQQAYHYWESEIWEKGKEIVQKNTGTVFEKSQGAVVFPGENYGLHTRVFITKNGTPTYEAKDMGLNTQKFEDWPYDLNLITTASEQNEYFKVIIKALELCSPELEGKVKHIGFGMVSLNTGKMSSRTGQILSAIDLLEEVTKRVTEIMAARAEMTKEEIGKIADVVAVGAVKFAFLKQNILQNMKFDIEESVSFEGRSGPYLQYTYARIQSILRKVSVPEATSKDGESLTLEPEKQLMRWLFRFPSIVTQAAETFSPHIIAEYTYQTAQYFNTFYTQCPISTESDEQKQRARRALAIKTAEIIKQGLGLLGIGVVERM